MDKIEKEKLFALRVKFKEETGFSCNVNDGEYTDWLEKEAIKNNGDIASVSVSVCPKCEYKLHSSGQCVNQFCSGWSRNTER